MRLLFIFLFATYFSFSQQLGDEIELEFSELKVKPDSTEKVDQLVSLFQKGVRIKYVNTLILDEAIKISELIYYADGLAKAYSKKGVTARYQNNYSKSIEYHKQALEYFEKSKDTLAHIKCLNSIGVTYRKLNLEQHAFKYYFKAYNLSEQIQHPRSMAIALNGIGNVFVNIKDYEKALYYFRKALKIEEDNNNKRGIEYDSANIGEVYIQNQQYDSAQVYLDRALKLSKINPRKDGIGIKHNLLGQLYQKKQNYKKSNEHYLASIEIFKAHNNSRYLSNTLINIGINKLYTQEFVQADQYIKEGLLIAKKISSKENILLGYNALSIYFNKQHHYKEALASFQMAVKFKDSMLNEASQKSIISTQIAFEAMEKNKLIQALNEEKKQNAQKAKDNYRNMIWMAIIGSILLLSLVVFIVLYRKNIDLELQKKNVELRQYVHQIDELKNETKQIEAQRQASLSSNMEKFDLSEREKEVLKLIAQGFKNSEIAAQLFVSNNTIKTHIKNIYIKLDVQNRIQAMKKVGV